MRNTVLIVEDDVILQLSYGELLETSGWTTLFASSSLDAMEEMRDHSQEIAVVVTDVEMPGTRDGLTLARQIRYGWPEIGIVVVSGAETPQQGELPEGVTFYRKPLSDEALAGVVEDAVRAAAEGIRH